MAARKVVGYHCYHCPDGSAETFHGFARTKVEARRLIRRPGLEECNYDQTVHFPICGLRAPDKSREGEPEWFGRDGFACIVPVYA